MPCYRRAEDGGHIAKIPSQCGSPSPSPFIDADDSCDSAHDDQQQPHGRLLMARSYERLHLLIYSSLCTIKRGGSPPTSPSWRSYCRSNNQISGIDSSARPHCRLGFPMVVHDYSSFAEDIATERN